MEKFMFVNNNPKNKLSCDCVIRSLRTLLVTDAETIIKDLTTIYINTGYFITDVRCYDKYLKNKGYMKCKQPKKTDGKKFTAAEFCTYLNEMTDISGTVVAHVGGHHMSTFVNVGTEKNRDYRVQDTWDCTEKCVGNYWIKK